MIAVVVMFFSFDVSLTELWEYITKAGYWLAAILGLWCVLYLMNAWAWRVIIQGGGPCMVGFMQLLKLTVSGFALNYATPVGLLGGEAYRDTFCHDAHFCPFLVLGDGCRGLLCHGFDGGCADK